LPTNVIGIALAAGVCSIRAPIRTNAGEIHLISALLCLYDIFPMGDRIGLPFLNAEPICATAQLNLPGTGCYHAAVRGGRHRDDGRIAAVTVDERMVASAAPRLLVLAFDDFPGLAHELKDV
jgi:hypothetical protein